MSTNKAVRKKLEKLYGAECFIEKLHLRIDTEPRRYKSKGQMKRMKQLTYHHILEKSRGRKNYSSKWGNSFGRESSVGLIDKTQKHRKK